MITENLSTLKIHKLTQAQYDRELEAGNIDANALYLTPDEETDLSGYATVEYVDTKAEQITSSIPTSLKNPNALTINGQGYDGSEAVTVNISDGEDGQTPHIGDNGNWWIGEEDTGVKAAGPAGDTPEKGVDYWTEEDKADIVDAVKAEVPLVKTAEQPTFVNSVDEMTDTSKVYIMPDGYLYAYMEGVEVTKLKSSEFALGQLNTNGVVAAGGNPVRIYTVAALSLENGKISVTPPTGYGYMVYFYNSDTPSENSIVGKTTWITRTVADVTTVNLASGSIDGATHCRFNFRDTASAGALDLTDYFDDFVNAEPIVITSNVKTKRWANTGLAYNQPADYEDRIAALESKLEGLEYGTY